MTKQKQKPERFSTAYRYEPTLLVCLVKAAETISAQLDYGLDRLDYLIEQNQQPYDPAIDSATHGDDGCVSHNGKEPDHD